MPWVSVAVTPLQLSSRDLPPPGLRLLPASGPAGRLRDAALRRIIPPVIRRVGNPIINRARVAAGLRPITTDAHESLYSPHLVLAQGVPGLEYPRSDLPAHVHFVGRIAPHSLARVDLPPWWPELTAARAAGRPVVHVTQGTLDVDPDDLLRPAIAALGGGEALVVCTTGGSGTAALGPLPGNVRAAPFLPHDLLLPLVDVMVTNGGWGGVLAAVQAGVPLVAAGGSLDKPEVARRVAWSGAGLDLRTGTPHPRGIRRAVTRVLHEPQFRRRAAELRAAMNAAGGAPTAVDLVEKHLA
jgi:UDP:flavonoid glycosyltransferase YjiC (YdhE family)